MTQNIFFDVIARDKASGTFSKIAKSSNNAESTLKRFGKTAGLALGAAGFATGAASIIKSSVGLEAAFSKTMAQVEVATGAGGEAIERLDKLAMKLGADTAFSAGEASGAMLELAKSGISASEIMGGALKGTLLLATAGSLDLATASTIASNAMNTFGLKGKDMNTIAAALAGGANASSASVESLGQALQQVGPGATNAGLSLQETVGALSAFDAAGVKGSDAGTALKTMLARLVPQTDAAKSAMRNLGLDFTDAQGAFVPITNIADQLQKKLGKLSEEQRTTALTTIFGSDATRAATVLMKQGSAGLAKYIKATEDQAAAQKLADANMSGTAGAMERLQGSVETAQLAIGKALAPTIQNLANFLSEDAVPAITEFITGMQEGTGAGGDVAAVIKDVTSVGKGMVDFLNGVPGPVKKIAVEGAIALVVFRKLSTGMTGFGGSLASPIARAKQFRAELSYTETRMGAVSRVSQQLGGTLKNLAGGAGLTLVASTAGSANEKLKTLGSVGGGALMGFSLGGPVGGAVGALAGGLFALGTRAQSASDRARNSLGGWKEYADTLDAVTGATTAATRAFAKQRLGAAEVLDTTRSLGIEDRKVVNAIVEGGKARQQVVGVLNAEKNALDAVYKAKLNAGTDSLREKQELAVLEDKTNARKKEIDAVLRELGAVAKSVAEKQKDIAATKDYGKALNALPKNLRLIVEEQGIVPTTKGIATLAAEIGATPKDIKTLISASGVPTTVAEVQRVQDKLNLLDGKSATVYIGAKVAAQVKQFGETLFGARDPKRARGGPVDVGQAYTVGETRAETFVPRVPGRIEPRALAPSATSTGADIDYARMTEAFIAALMRVPITRLPDAGRGAYMSGASL